MPDVQTQNKMIMEYLKANGSITVQQAQELFGCYRLSARIYDLRHKYQMKIESIMMESINRFGARTRFARYFVKKKDEVTANG